jgi:hypothetical protein
MRNFPIILTFMTITLAACQGGKEHIPASVVHNPNSADGPDDNIKIPVLAFNTTNHDFGRIIQGEVVSFSFKFTNTGTADLVIAGIDAACGCTASEYPRMPVKPGEEASVKVRFDSGGKRGFQNKTLTVMANTHPSQTVLTVKAEVVTPERD